MQCLHLHTSLIFVSSILSLIHSVALFGDVQFNLATSPSPPGLLSTHSEVAYST